MYNLDLANSFFGTDMILLKASSNRCSRRMLNLKSILNHYEQIRDFWLFFSAQSNATNAYNDMYKLQDFHLLQKRKKNIICTI